MTTGPDSRGPARSERRHPGAGAPSAAEAELWRRTQEGDSEAFGDLYERYATAIYTYCFRRTGEWSAAEELLSVVFLEAWRQRKRLRAPERGAAWLYGIATNVIRTRRRAERRHQAALARLAASAITYDAFDEVEARVDDEGRMKAILRSFQRLSKREQDVLALCVWSGLSYEEAGAALGIPVGTVRSRLARAKQHLVELTVGRGHLRSGSHFFMKGEET